MMTRVLGRGAAALEVGALGLGCMGMSEFYGRTDDEESTRVLDRAADLGVTLFDTADMYGMGRNEELLGRWLRGRPREGIVIATKFGVVRDSTSAQRRGIRGDRDYIRQACDASLSRLGIDVIDLYYQHRVDPDVPIEESVGALADLVAAGKVRHIGLSEAASDTLRRAHAVHPITALQTEWSLWTRDLEDDIVPTARELGIGIVAYSPLGRGFLSGRIDTVDTLAADDFRRVSPRFSDDNLVNNLEALAGVDQLAAGRGVSLAQLSLAWVLARGEDIVPIPGTKRVAYLEENMGAADLVLTPDELAAIETAAPRTAFSGDRYPDMRSVSGVTRIA